MSFTLSQAAKEVGKAKSSLFKAIKNGKMSALKNEEGQYQIDPAELYRVFPCEQKNEQARTEENNGKTTLIEEKVKYLEREIGRLERTETDLREDRDHWRRQATALLTHQQPEQSAVQDQGRGQEKKKGIFSRIFG